jgi:uncharacterized membrane protein YkvA (DUF1232 family)
MAKAARWAAVRSLANAVRIAVRPGGPSLGERVASLPRLVRATFRGEYTGTSRRRLLMLLGAVLYVVSPVDFVPEALLSVFGLIDDAFVLSWIAAVVVTETESYLAWERTAPPADRRGGPRLGPQDTAYGTGPQDTFYGGASQDARNQTVPGHVVP